MAGCLLQGGRQAWSDEMAGKINLALKDTTRLDGTELDWTRVEWSVSRASETALLAAGAYGYGHPFASTYTSTCLKIFLGHG